MRKKILCAWRYFTVGEKLLWISSVGLILLSHFLFSGDGVLTLIASLVGVSSLLFNAKGHWFGQCLMILFSLLYGVISFSFSYYGEMITYLGMTAPMAVAALLSWLWHPYGKGHSTVKVARLSGRDALVMLLSTLAVTVLFYFILKALHTAHLIPGTVSIATSFLAAYLTYKRSPLFALAYAANDLVLILLWLLAAMTDPSYISVAVCFVVFLFNDMYGFLSWSRMKKSQSS